MRWLGAALLVLLVLASSGVLPMARFTAETIAIDIEGDRIQVDATYVYENPFPFPIRQGMSVPFPPGYEPVAVALTKDNVELPLRRLGHTESFELPLPAFGTASVRLRYDQYAPAHHATYLLTTTAPWHRRIQRGFYVLRSHGSRITGSSYQLTQNNSFERRDFMPPVDWSFTWR